MLPLISFPEVAERFKKSKPIYLLKKRDVTLSRDKKLCSVTIKINMNSCVLFDISSGS